MRTTLSLDDDVAHELERRQRRERRPMKQVVNEALRVGLAQLDRSRSSGETFQTEPLDLGRCRLQNVDPICETLALAEGEDFR